MAKHKAKGEAVGVSMTRDLEQFLGIDKEVHEEQEGIQEAWSLDTEMQTWSLVFSDLWPLSTVFLLPPLPPDPPCWLSELNLPLPRSA
jgi:hypothetical protein